MFKRTFDGLKRRQPFFKTQPQVYRLTPRRKALKRTYSFIGSLFNISFKNFKPVRAIAIFVLSFFIISFLSGSTFQSAKSMNSGQSQDNISNLLKDDNKPKVSGEIIVKYKSNSIQAISLNGFDASNKAVSKEKVFDNVNSYDIKSKYAERSQRVSGPDKEIPDLSNIYRLKFNSDQDIKTMLLNYNNQPNVEYATYNYIYRTEIIPNDPQYPTPQWWADKINLPNAWDVTTGSETNTIAILDTGIRGTHEDLTSKVLAGYDFINNQAIAGGANSDDEGHGTAVAGAAAAIGNNAKGMAGTAWNTKLMPVKVMNSSGEGSSTSIARGIYYAINNGADIINLSLGMTLIEDPFFSDLLRRAHNFGIIVVAAAGNEAVDANVSDPANIPYVITVGATDINDSLASFSNFGSKIDVMAPGVEIRSTSNASDTSYITESGTSLSAPIVSGVAALMLSSRPELTSEQVRQILRNTADDTGTAGYDYYHGYGRINANVAVRSTLDPSTALIDPLPHIDGNLVTIKGTAAGTNFASYKLEYGPLGGTPSSPVYPSSLTQIGPTKTTLVIDGDLVEWNPSGITDPFVFLKLTVTNTDSTTSICGMLVYVTHGVSVVFLNKIEATNDSTPTFTGVAKVGSQAPLNDKITDVYYWIDDQQMGSKAIINPSSGGRQVNFTITPSSPLEDGMHSLIVEAIPLSDPQGSYVRTAGNQFIIDTSAPASPVITSPLDQSGTETSPIVVIGTIAEPFLNVELFLNNNSIGTIQANKDGNWAEDGVNLNIGANTLKAKATDAAGNESSFSDIVNVNYAVPYFAITASSDNVTAGTDLSIDVTAKKSTGETNTLYTGTVSFSSNDPQAVLPANYTFVSGDAGTHTFTDTILKTAGSKTISVTGGTMTGTTAITVSPAAPNVLAKISGDSQQAYVNRSLPEPLIVQAQDSYNNAIFGQTLSVLVTAGVGSVNANNITTSSDGKASVNWTLGPTAGANTLTISGFSQTVTFNATALAFPNNVTTTNGSGGTPIQSQDNLASIIFPANSVSAHGKVSVSQLTDNIPATPAGKKLISNVYNLTFEKETGGYLFAFGPSLPTMAINYNTDLITGVNLDSAKLYFLQAEVGGGAVSWSTYGVTTTQVDAENRKVVGTTNHFTPFAVLADQTTEAAETAGELPTTGSHTRTMFNLLLALVISFTPETSRFLRRKKVGFKN